MDPAGLEPAAFGLGNQRSIRLNYGSVLVLYRGLLTRRVLLPDGPVRSVSYPASMKDCWRLSGEKLYVVLSSTPFCVIKAALMTKNGLPLFAKLHSMLGHTRSRNKSCVPVGVEALAVISARRVALGLMGGIPHR